MNNYRMRIHKIRPRKIEGGYSYGSVDHLKYIGKWEVRVRQGNSYLYLSYFDTWDEAIEAGYEVIEQHQFDALAFS